MPKDKSKYSKKDSNFSNEKRHRTASESDNIEDNKTKIRRSYKENDLKRLPLSKKERRAKRQDKRLTKPHGELIEKQLKTSWIEAIEQQTTKERRTELVDFLYSNLKGKFNEVVYTNLPSRYIQTIIKFGTQEQIKQIHKELKKSYIEISENPFGSHIVMKIIKHSKTDTKLDICSVFLNKSRKVLVHRDAGTVLNFLYDNMNAKGKQLLTRKLYGPNYNDMCEILKTTPALTDLAKLSEDNIIIQKLLPKVYEDMNRLVQKIIVKDMLSLNLCQKMVLDFLMMINKGDNEADHLISQLRGYLVEVLHTNIGYKIAVWCILYGDAKDRKNIAKTFKDHINTIALDGNGYRVLIALIRHWDDIKNLQKLVINQMDILQLVNSPFGFQVILSCLVDNKSNDLRYIVPDVKYLFDEITYYHSKEEKEVSTTKKSITNRMETIRNIFYKVHGKKLRNVEVLSDMKINKYGQKVLYCYLSYILDNELIRICFYNELFDAISDDEHVIEFFENENFQDFYNLMTRIPTVNAVIAHCFSSVKPQKLVEKFQSPAFYLFLHCVQNAGSLPLVEKLSKSEKKWKGFLKDNSKKMKDALIEATKREDDFIDVEDIINAKEEEEEEMELVQEEDEEDDEEEEEEEEEYEEEEEEEAKEEIDEHMSEVSDDEDDEEKEIQRSIESMDKNAGRLKKPKSRSVKGIKNLTTKEIKHRKFKSYE
eukprot:TRINITY_DN3101_c1_g1_i1.p1 TRINITY_DN3101_c1_g1~~TRINITY_DN3101_c1_g1_i1.p1  ORF type:complete len:709 (+),score=237.59 TRINITY_DN3101_c1_g1_i1:35-2161(+)